MIEINGENCIGCLRCVTVCPSAVFDVADGNPKPNPEKACLHCYHCAAICPQQAITDGQKDAIAPEEESKGRGFTDEFKYHAMHRRSYRHFSDKPVPHELIEEALELGGWGASAKNQHPTRWMVIESRETIEAIMQCILEYVDETGVSPEIAQEYAGGNNVVMGSGATLILAYARESSIVPETDTAIAMTTAEIFLQSQGVGTCWAGYLRDMCNEVPKIRALLPKLPPRNRFYGAFLIGYPENETYPRLPKRRRETSIKWI